jgi:hypothetical protein
MSKNALKVYQKDRENDIKIDWLIQKSKNENLRLDAILLLYLRFSVVF